MRETLFPDLFDVANMNVEQMTEEVKNLTYQERMFSNQDYNYFVELIYERIQFSNMLFYFLLFFVVAYLFYASFFVSLGALSGSESDGQQFVIPLVFILFFEFSYNQQDLGRYTSFEDSQRVRIFHISLEFISKNLFFGGQNQFARLLLSNNINVKTSHNIFLNSFIFSGIFGAITVIYLYFKMVFNCIIMLKKDFLKFNEGSFFAAGLGAALGLAAGFEAAFAFGFAAERTAGFATGLDAISGEATGFRLLAGLAGACSKNPANSAGSSLATSSCTCDERSGRWTVPSVPPLPALPLRRPASLSICRSADRTFC
jgi:hypothetical protein